MGFLDGLKDMFGGGQQIAAGREGANGLLQAPQMQQGPGLLDRLRAPDANGVTFSDKLSAMGGILAGDDNPYARIDAAKKANAETQQRARRNQAFMAAYKNGKFDPAAYAEALGSANVDPSDIAALEKAFNHQQSDSQYVEGPDGIYQVDKPSGQTRRVQEYPAKPNTTPGQINPQTGRWEWAPGYLDAIGSRAEVQREAVVKHPMPSRGGGGGRGGGTSWLPPGAKIVHMPGQ